MASENVPVPIKTQVDIKHELDANDKPAISFTVTEATSEDTTDGGAKLSNIHANGTISPDTAEKDEGLAAAGHKDNDAGDGPAVDGKSPASPTSPKTTSSHQDKLSRPKNSIEKSYHAQIIKAHAQVRDGTTSVSPEDQQKDMIKYAEMVSQMTHMLAALGVGRNTTVRALAYLNGPENPSHAQALRQAKSDRREQYNKKRITSNGSGTSNKDKEDDLKNKPNPAINTSSSHNATDESAPINTPATNGSEQACLTNGPNSITNKENENPTTTNGQSAGNDEAKSAGRDASKKSYRRKWWGRKARNSSGKHEGEDVNEAVDKGAEAALKGKTVTSTSAGTPDAVAPARPATAA